MYDVTDCFPTDSISALDPGTNLLIVGPPMVGKREFALDLIATGHDAGDAALLIMSSESAAVPIEDLSQQRRALDADRIGIIDCMDNDDRRNIEGIETYSLSAPDDLPGISTKSAKLLRSFAHHGVSTVRHGFISITTLLQYLDRETVFKFLYIYKQRVVDTSGLGIFTIDRTRHDKETLTMFESLCDGTIDLRVADSGEREVDVRGLDR